MKTELVWDGKYDEYGARRPVDIAGSAMPMQKVETVDMPRSEALAGGRQAGWPCYASRGDRKEQQTKFIYYYYNNILCMRPLIDFAI